MSESRTRELTFSSEMPVERWFGFEILDHSPSAVRMEFFKSGNAPLLLNHDSRLHIGVVERAAIRKQDRVGEATVRFGRSSIAGEALGNVDDGILRNTSVSYRIHRLKLDSTSDTEGDTYRATDWEPLEASLVAVPADTSVGIGRSLDTVFNQPARTAAPKEPQVAKETAAAGTSADVVEVTRTAEPSETFTDPVEFEKRRKEAIRKYASLHKVDERIERVWIETGADLNKVADDLMAIQNERSKKDPGVAYLDLSKGETRRYSLMRALRAAANNDWDSAGIELECNKEISKRLDRTPKSRAAFFVPLDVLMGQLPGRQQRDMTSAGASGSQYLVGVDNLVGSFIDLLRNTSVALRMGVTPLRGLRGNLTIPKMTAGTTGYWLADEATQITESQPTIGQLALSPKNVAALTEISHQLLSQSTPDAEQLVLTSIARDIGLAVDVGILRGSGASGQPTGIATTGSIGAFTGTSLASPGVLDAQADVAGSNALNPGCGYATTPAVAALLMQRPELPSTGTERLWKGNMLQGTIFDFPAMSSAQMSTATALFGWWPSVILAEWGVLELMVNPFSDFTRGLSAVRGWYTCDVGVRYAGAWSYSSSIT